MEFQDGLAEQFIQLTDSILRSAGHGDDHFVEFFGPAVEQTFRHADHGHFVDSFLPFLRIIVEEGDNSAAEFLFCHQFPRELRARASGADDAYPRRRSGRFVFLPGRALAPQPEEDAKAAEQRNRQERINENDVPWRRAPGAGSPPAQQPDGGHAQRGADLPQFRKTKVAEQASIVLSPGQTPKLQGQHG